MATSFRINKLSLAEALRALRSRIKLESNALQALRAEWVSTVSRNEKNDTPESTAHLAKMLREKDIFINGLKAALSTITAGDE